MEILLNGKFTDQERSELSKELNIQVYEYKTKAVDLGEIVRLVFRDFDALSLLRDGILFSMLSGLVKKSYTWLKNKKPKAKVQISTTLIFEEDNKSISANIGLPSLTREDDKKFWEDLENKLNIEFINETKNKEIINISWDESKKELTIIKF